MTWLVLFLLVVSPAEPPASEGPLVDRVRLFRSLIDRQDFDAARAMMADDPRRWWEGREGAGAPWTIGTGGGPWASWDAHFASKKEIVGWRKEDRAVSVIIRESNDYYRLLERGSPLNEATYFFDADGRIEGLLIRGIGDRPPGRTEEFRHWARAHAPEELEAVMPEGEIDPSDPVRFRALLNRWRIAIGEEPIGSRAEASAAGRAEAVKAMATRYGGAFQVDASGSLVVVDLHQSDVTDADLALLGSIPTLREIDLRLTTVSDAGVRHLAGLIRLETLNLFRTRLTDEGLASLAGLTGLRTLLIGGTGITSGGLMHLEHLTHLRKLSVFDTAVGDGAVARLGSLPSLEVLLIGKSKISDAGAEELRRRNPRLSFTDI